MLLLKIFTVKRIGKGLNCILRGRFAEIFSVISDLRHQEKMANARDIVVEEFENEPLPFNQPLISIIIPCFNYGSYVTEAVEGHYQQLQ